MYFLYYFNASKIFLYFYEVTWDCSYPQIIICMILRSLSRNSPIMRCMKNITLQTGNEVRIVSHVRLCEPMDCM